MGPFSRWWRKMTCSSWQAAAGQELQVIFLHHRLNGPIDEIVGDVTIQLQTNQHRLVSYLSVYPKNLIDLIGAFRCGKQSGDIKPFPAALDIIRCINRKKRTVGVQLKIGARSAKGCYLTEFFG